MLHILSTIQSFTNDIDSLIKHIIKPNDTTLLYRESLQGTINYD